MRKLLLSLALFSGFASAMAEELIYNDKLCFDIVGEDTANPGAMLVELKGSTESRVINLNVPLSFEVDGVKYFVSSVAPEAFAGKRLSTLWFSGICTSKFVFKENCFKGARCNSFIMPSFFAMGDVEVVFETGSFANLRVSNPMESMTFTATSTQIMEGAFTGMDCPAVSFNGEATIAGGAFGESVTSVEFSAPVRTECEGDAKVFPGLKTLVLKGPNKTPLSLHKLTALTDFESNTVDITVSNLFVVPDAGNESGNAFNSTVRVPAFMVDAYKNAPVWKRFNIVADSSVDYPLDETGKYYLGLNPGGKANIVGYKGTPEADLEIPAVFRADGADYGIYQIHAGPFTGCTSITSLSLPAGVYVCADAFAGCTSLRSLKVDNVSLDGNSFNGAPVSEIDIKVGVTSFASRSCSKAP